MAAEYKFTMQDCRWLERMNISLTEQAGIQQAQNVGLELIRTQQLLKDQKDANDDLKLMVYSMSVTILLLFGWVILLGYCLWGR